jgi:outer membrane protein OmpA-like peptidoglycan-associated protein
MKRIFAILFVASAASFVGCHSEEPARSPRARVTTQRPMMSPRVNQPSRSTSSVVYLHASDDFRKACAGTEAYFEYNSTEVKPEAHSNLSGVAQCLKNGPLSDKTITLVGRADPRGTENYNDQLGLDRAKEVKDYLVGQGIPENRIQMKSAGEEGASQWPENWPLDRRVDIILNQ